jgi:hypothetical protein
VDATAAMLALRDAARRPALAVVGSSTSTSR